MGTILPCPAHAAREWQVLENPVLIEHPTNDGDSFRVRWDGTDFILRIYFADAPEQDLKWRDRVEAQADYFGITLEEAVEVGQMATEFTLEQLREGFTVRTRWQNVFSNSRIKRKYGFVTLSDGRDLAEALVENGLARVHGIGVRGRHEQVERLRELEEEARLARRGAWGFGSSASQEADADAHESAQHTRQPRNTAPHLIGPPS